MEQVVGFVENSEDFSEEKSLSCSKKENVILSFFYKVIKRFVDIIVGIIGIVFLIPLTILVFIFNRISKDNGPLFYSQERIGKNGKIFKMLKFRSMVIGAEEKLKEYLKENKEARDEYKKYKKLKNDPRITKMGMFLRKTSLDEMPQLIHLLSGKMSLVGPRPYLPDEKEDMGEYYNLIVNSKPGLTGLRQVSGRSNATFDERLDLDIKYITQKSMKLDFVILYKTFIYVIKNEGAI